MIKTLLNLLFNKKPASVPAAQTKPDPLPFEFKDNSARLKNEYDTLSSKNQALKDLIDDVARFVKKETGKTLVITMIYRTQEEQDNLYKNDPKYSVRKFKSPHQFWHSVDLRSRIFTDEEIRKIEAYINQKYNPINYYNWTAKNHKIIGNVDHFHIQLSKR